MQYLLATPFFTPPLYFCMLAEKGLVQFPYVLRFSYSQVLRVADWCWWLTKASFIKCGYTQVGVVQKLFTLSVIIHQSTTPMTWKHLKHPFQPPYKNKTEAWKAVWLHETKNHEAMQGIVQYSSLIMTLKTSKNDTIKAQ